jgi:hypothetical protein
MKRFSQQFKNSSERVKLTKAESRDLRERLVAYMEYHPLPAERRKAAAVPAGALTGEPFRIFTFNTVRTRAFFSVATLAVILMVPFAAEQTVPGDVLYPVKVRFNEEVRSSLAVTPYQQIQWETKRVERRLAEARLLATEGKLTEEVEAEVAAAVKVHTDAAQAGLAELRETDQEEAAIAELTFASALEVESEVLEQETKRQQAAGASTTVTLAAAIADVRATVATPETTEVSFERLLAQVEEETTRASELLLSLDRTVSDVERADINRRLEDIERKVQLAITTHTPTLATEIDKTLAPVAPAATSSEFVATTTDGATTTVPATTTTAAVSEVPATTTTAVVAAPDTERAKQYLREALTATQKLIRFMTDINVKANLSVEELVPVTPTGEERQAALEVAVVTLENRLAKFTELVVSGVVLSEKDTLTIDRVSNLITTIETAIETAEFTSGETAASEARDLLSDMERINAELLSAPELPTTATTTEETVVEEPGLTEPATTTESLIETEATSTEETI